ncbi:MAG: hypothetical protein PWQ35_185 [Patescibacteria group bacterium]|nr:hypothetical protein [Patescibacteria group bacterium]
MWEKLKKVKFVNIFWVLFYSLIFLVLVNTGFNYLDPDLGWHLKVGQEIAINRQVPTVNLYNYTYTGNWVDHEWLGDLLAYLAFDNWGYEFLVIFFAALITFTFIILNLFIYKSLNKKTIFPFVAIFQLLGIFASLPHFGVRMQEFGVLFLLLLLIIIDLYSRSGKRKYLFFLPLLFLFWANLHASFILGLFICFAWLGIKIGERILLFKKNNLYFLKLDKALPIYQIKHFFYFTLLSLGATLINPYTYKLYSFLGGYKNQAYLSLIQEWLPQYRFPLHYDQLIYLALGTIVLLFVTYRAFKRKDKIELWPFFLTFLFLILSFKSRRHFPLFVVASFLPLISFYSDFFSGLSLKSYRGFLKALTILCLLLVILNQALSINFITQPFSSFCNRYPCAAVDFIKENDEYKQAKLLNVYDWGGFLIWTLPEKKIFIDGRLPQVEYNGKTFIEEYRRFFNKEEDKAYLLNQYGIDLVLLKSSEEPLRLKKWERIFFQIRKEQLNSKNYLRDYLEIAPEWEQVYQDETALIYKRRAL